MIRPFGNASGFSPDGDPLFAIAKIFCQRLLRHFQTQTQITKLNAGKTLRFFCERAANDFSQSRYILNRRALSIKRIFFFKAIFQPDTFQPSVGEVLHLLFHLVCMPED
jgi:hypothetical protein